MRGLTIQQPYAALIATGQKRVENRSWSTTYRGPLLIHAGRSRDLLEEDEDRPGYELCGLRIADLAFGAVIAVVDLAGCVDCNLPRWAIRQWPWLESHLHFEGPCCFVLENIRPIAPIPWRGAMGLWDVPAELESMVNAKLGA